MEDYYFESLLTNYRIAHFCEFLESRPARRILEVGCGPRLFVEAVKQREIHFDAWCIVEPSLKYFEFARDNCVGDDRITLINDYVEYVSSEIGQEFDGVIVSGVLHETTEPRKLLTATIRFAREGAWVYGMVPNANSVHRMIAVEMGLIETVDALGERNRKLDQTVVYTADSFKELFASVGLTDLVSSGYMLKPFTHAQMEYLVHEFGEELVFGLYKFGRNCPKFAAEIVEVGTRPITTKV